jgi:hypothetical protein
MVQSISPSNWPKGRNFQFVWPLRFDYGNGVKLGVCILAAAASLLLTGCVLKGKAQANVSSTPAPPKPAPAPPPPLSIPQTQAELPAHQPISPEALATTPPEGPVEIQPAPRPLRRGAAFGPPKPETPPTLTVTDQPPRPAPAPETARPPIQEVLPPAELQRLKNSADARKREVRKVLDQMGSRQLNNQRETGSRIRSFLQLSDNAEAKNEMRNADELAERAQTLVRDLRSGR